MKYKSDIELGRRYRDKHTGIEGVSICIAFFEHACERVTIRYAHDGEIKEASFDAAELENVETGKTPRTDRTGGARPMPERSSSFLR